MAVRRASKALRRIKDRILRGQYEFTRHARDEMKAEDLWDADVRGAIRSGTLARVQREEPRGSRYTVHGRAVDGRQIAAVVREVSERIRIITVYVVGWRSR